MIKLIVADMDGTLLNDDHQLHPDFWEIEKNLSDKNILFAVASGRQYYNLEYNFKRISDRMIFFSENGTHVVHKGKDLHVNSMDIEAARDFIRIGREIEDVNPVLCCKGSAYVECKDERF
jgi:HAD superfamily hydrolase (TIGR01484 family)